MIDLTTIQSYYGPQEKLQKRNILREFIQCEILNIIFNSPISSKLAFLGGTASRLLYGNARFSEDLDFDNFSLTADEFKRLSEEIKSGLQKRGYNVEIKCIFKDSYRIYIRLSDILFESGISPLKNEKLMIQVDTKSHEFSYKPDRITLSKLDIFTDVFATPLDIMFSQKIHAALERHRAKGRDFFDIVFLSPRTKPNYRYLEEKTGIKNATELKEKLAARIADYDFAILARDVDAFLYREGDRKKIVNFKEYLAGIEF
jgi:predicted nucleotidyltransferase component of viral defense system